MLTVEVGLDVPDGGLRARAEASMPRLRAAYVQTVIIYAAGLPAGASPNADFLAQSLNWIKRVEENLLAVRRSLRHYA